VQTLIGGKAVGGEVKDAKLVGSKPRLCGAFAASFLCIVGCRFDRYPFDESVEQAAEQRSLHRFFN